MKFLIIYIDEFEYPKQAWGMLETSFTKKNDALLQLLECDFLISLYVSTIKNLYRENEEPDP